MAEKHLKTYLTFLALSQKMWFICRMEYYSAIKTKDIINFAGKRMELENIQSEVMQSQKDMHSIYSFISGYRP